MCPTRLVRSIGVLLVAAVVFSAQRTTAQLQPAQAPVLPPVVSNATAPLVGVVGDSERLNLLIHLPLRNQPQLTSLLQALYDPSSVSYHHYLSVAEFTEQFGPTDADYKAVVAWASANGFNVTSTPPNKRFVGVEASVGTINKAFNVTIRNYQHPTEARVFYAPDREPSTLGLGVTLLQITGMDNYVLPHPRLSNSPTAFTTTGSGNNGATYLPGDIRAAYYGNGPLTGAGQSIGLIEFGGYLLSDVWLFYQEANMLPWASLVPLVDVQPTGNGGTYCTCTTYNNSTVCTSNCTMSGSANGEAVLDIGNALGMAPGVAQIVTFEGNDGGVVAQNLMATYQPLTPVLSNSWGWNPDSQASSEPILQELAAQGQSYLSASGDNGAYYQTAYNPQGGVDPWTIEVGGTNLTTTGPLGGWATENAWGGSGGGYLISTAIGIGPGGEHSCAVISGGVQCWGWNAFGELGNNSTTESHEAVQVSYPNIYGTPVSSGGNACTPYCPAGAAYPDPTCSLECCQCPPGDSYPNPACNLNCVSPTLNLGGVTTVAAGAYHTCAIVNGIVQCWGDNSYGQLGINFSPENVSQYPMAFLVHGVHGVTAIAAGAYHTCAVANGGVNGTAWCWGDNANGQLGNNSTNESDVPVEVLNPAGTGPLSGVIAIVAGGFHTCALTVNGPVYCWGYNYSGQLGDNSTNDATLPVQVAGLGMGSGVTALAAGDAHTCAVVDGGVNGVAWCWGWNGYGQLGNNSTNESNVPVQVLGEFGIGPLGYVQAITAGFAHTCAIVNSGAWCWGDNVDGDLGINWTNSQSNLPVPSGGLIYGGVQAIAAGFYHTCALVYGGVLCWGDNVAGQLGNNSTNNSDVPVAVLGLQAVPIPWWQQLAGVINPSNENGSNQGSTVYRNSPDVAADASNDNLYVSGGVVDWCCWGGTSYAAPRWAGFLALANQQSVANGGSTVGFINPAIYELGVGSNYGLAFHDITSGNNSEGNPAGLFNAVAGYDLVTGWGSPNGASLINLLAPFRPSPVVTHHYGSTSSNDANETSSQTITGVSGNTGDMILVLVSASSTLNQNNAGPIAPPSDNGLSKAVGWTYIVNAGSPSGYAGTQVWYCVLAAPASNVTITFNGDPGQPWQTWLAWAFDISQAGAIGATLYGENDNPAEMNGTLEGVSSPSSLVFYAAVQASSGDIPTPFSGLPWTVSAGEWGNGGDNIGGGAGAVTGESGNVIIGSPSNSGGYGMVVGVEIEAASR